MLGIQPLLAGKGPRFGSIVQVPHPLVVEAYGRAGFDFVILDQEHGPLSTDRLGDLVRAAEASGVVPLVRVPENRPSLIGAALDQGARGVVVPGIRGVEDARAAVEAARYPPEGQRGYCSAVRSAGILPDAQAATRANREVCVFLLIETLGAVDAVDDIAQLPGADVLFVGPGDLSAQMGVPGQLSHPDVERAVEKVAERALARGKTLAVHVRDVDTAARYVRRGFRVVSFGIDLQILTLHLREVGAALRGRVWPTA